MMSEPQEDAVIAELRRISDYLRELASFNRRHELARALEDPERRRAYVLSDGMHTRDDIAADDQITKSGRTISNWWSDWVEDGLADRTDEGSAKARYDVHVIDVIEVTYDD